MTLNPNLYALLCRRFGRVVVVRSGEPMSGSHSKDLVTDHAKFLISDWGESYKIACPVCRDHKPRLYINHRYGVRDPVTGEDGRRFVKCFNEECFKKRPELYDLFYDDLLGMKNADSRDSYHQFAVVPLVTGVVEELKPGPPPGPQVVSLTALASDHKAVEYIRSRGYDPFELEQRFMVGYCKVAHPRYYLAQDRIICPVVTDNIMAGWQARYPGELSWKEARIPKYLTLPGLAKRLVLYNGDVALQRKFAVIVEGPTSCWPLWPNGCAILGKQASHNQIRRLARYGKNHPLVVMLDSDAQPEAERLAHRLRQEGCSAVFNVVLPDNRDPGDYQKLGKVDDLWDEIVRQAGVALVL